MPRAALVRRSLLAISAAALLGACGPAGTPPPQPPTALDDAYASPKDTVLSVPAPGVSANDDLAGGALDAGNRASAAGGTVALFADGRFLYEPLAGFDGVDTFTYTITNAGGASDPATVTIEVPALPWTTLPPLPRAVSRPAAAVVDGVLYVIGGEGLGLWFGEVFAIERGGAWTLGPETTPTPMGSACAAAIGSDVYLVGGYNSGAKDLLQVLDTTTGAWSAVASDPLPAEREGMACAVHDGRLYAFGGRDLGGVGTTSAWRYDPSAAPGTRWTTTLEALPEARYYPGAATIGGQVFVAGGLDGADSASVFAYDVAANAWTTYPDLQTARGGPGVWVSGPFLYVGGGGWNSYLASVERYDTRTGPSGSWSSAAPLGQGRRTMAYGSVDGWFYAVAGYDGTYADDAEEGLLRANLP
jgi:hypothetical protein